MRKTCVLWALFCLASVGADRTLAQSMGSAEGSQSSTGSMQSMATPKIIWIYREEVRPARGATHEKVESRFAQLWKKAGVQPYLSLDAISGDANESIFIAGYNSFAELEKDFKTFDQVSSGPLKNDYESLADQEAGLLNGAYSSIAVYRPDLSYLGDRFMGTLPKSRYIEVERFNVRFGRDDSFAMGAKAYQEVYRELNLEEPWVVYQVTSGAMGGTYLVLSSMDSLSDMDRHMARRLQIEQAVDSKMGNKMKDAGESFSFVQADIYRLNPKTSNVSDEFAAADPSFWKPAANASGGIQALARADFSTDPAVIRRVQQALSDLGYIVGTPDGIAGKQTRSAIRLFQKDQSLPITGVIDRETAGKLGI